jgi:2'-5' RNA ligase
MLNFKDFLDDSIIYAPGMSEEEMRARLWESRPRFLMESVGITDQYLFAGVPTLESKEEILHWLHSLDFATKPKFVPMPQVHLTIRFGYNTLVDHIEEVKKVIDNVAGFKQENNIPVGRAAIMGKYKTLFGFEFEGRDGRTIPPELKRAANIFDKFMNVLTKERQEYKFRPHMKLAEGVRIMPKIESHPQEVRMRFVMVRGILNAED